MNYENRNEIYGHEFVKFAFYLFATNTGKYLQTWTLVFHCFCCFSFVTFWKLFCDIKKFMYILQTQAQNYCATFMLCFEYFRFFSLVPRKMFIRTSVMVRENEFESK